MSYNYFTPNYFGEIEGDDGIAEIITENIEIEIEYDEIEIIVEVE